MRNSPLEAAFCSLTIALREIFQLKKITFMHSTKLLYFQLNLCYNGTENIRRKTKKRKCLVGHRNFIKTLTLYKEYILNFKFFHLICKRSEIL